MIRDCLACIERICSRTNLFTATRTAATHTEVRVAGSSQAEVLPSLESDELGCMKHRSKEICRLASKNTKNYINAIKNAYRQLCNKLSNALFSTVYPSSSGNENVVANPVVDGVERGLLISAHPGVHLDSLECLGGGNDQQSCDHCGSGHMIESQSHQLPIFSPDQELFSTARPLC